MAVAQSLYVNATRNNNVAAQIWWTKARMGWKSVANVNVGGTDRPAAIDLSWAPALFQNQAVMLCAQTPLVGCW